MIRTMRLLKRKMPWVILLVIALIALLPVLAVLQYRWLGQVSQAERERMQANLRLAISQFRQGFDGELSRIFLHFQSAPAGPIDRIETYFNERMTAWRSSSPYPRLVSEVYWLDCTRPDCQLARFDSAARHLTTSDWPPEFVAWRHRLQATANRPAQSIQTILEDIRKGRAESGTNGIVIRRKGLEPSQRKQGSTEDSAAEKTSQQVIALLGQTVAHMPPSYERVLEDGPAIIIPVLSSSEMVLPSDPGLSVARGYVLVKLDLDYLKDSFVPALVERYFHTDSGFDYQIAVLSRRDPSQVIYRSSPNVTTSIAESSDGSSGILAVRPEDFGSLLAEKALMRKGSSPGATSTEPNPADRFTMRVFSRGSTEGLRNRVVPDLEGYWQIFLKHKAGSLEAAVSQARRRSLAISFGVLLLLGASIGLLLVSTRRAQRLAEQQMEFVAGVSHELRTPLAVIRSAAENLADGYIGTPEHIQRYGALIRDEGRRLTEMVEQVLEVAGIQSGRRAYQLRPVNTRHLIEQAISACDLLITEGHLQVETDIESELPWVAADPAALSRAIQNLISNAAKYSGESRWIGIRAGTENTENGVGVSITVENRGIGILPGDLPHIFEPFFRGRDVVSAQIHGSGLGLNLVKHIIESHGGRVSVESAPGRKTAFTLHLPATDLKETEASAIGGYEQTNTAH
jgi:two-component system, OmpR family, sensor histidine kinase SenX3